MPTVKVISSNGLVGIEYNGEKLFNLCPHVVKVMLSEKDNEIAIIPQSGMVARINKLPPDMEKHAGLSISREVYGEVYGIPDPIDNALFIVSGPVINMLNDSRNDVVAIGRQLRNDNGDSVSAMGLRRQF